MLSLLLRLRLLLQMATPCGLNQGQLERLLFIAADQTCTARPPGAAAGVLCGALFTEHPPEQAAASSAVTPSAAVSEFPAKPLDQLLECVGRVLTRSPVAAASDPDAPFEFSGQCVAVHAQVLLTAAHVCWDDKYAADDPRARLQLKVVFVGKGGHVRELDAEMVRWSGKMDIAILRLQLQQDAAGGPGAGSPFKPLAVADATCIDAGCYNTPCALVAFDLPRDGDALRQGLPFASGVVVGPEAMCKLPHIPSWNPSSLSAVDRVQRGSRSFLLARAMYFNQKGVSGGAVVGVDAAAGGQLVLLGIHTHGERLAFGDQLHYVAAQLGAIGEFDGPGAPPVAQEDEEMKDADAHGGAAGHGASSIGQTNRREPDSTCDTIAPAAAANPNTIKDVNTRLDGVSERAEHEAGGTGKAVFAVAHAFLQGRWSIEQVMQDAAPVAAAAAPPALRIVPPSSAKSTYSSPRQRAMAAKGVFSIAEE